MKNSHLQIRVSDRDKKFIKSKALSEGLSVSEWVLKVVGATRGECFLNLVHEIDAAAKCDEQAAYAALSDYLAGLKNKEFSEVLPRPERLSSEIKEALIASMVEYAAARVGAHPPEWASRIGPLEEPLFLTTLFTLRPYLMRVSPIQFKRRNIFVDSAVGGRV